MINRFLATYNYTFAQPYFLWLLLLIPLYFFFRHQFQKNRKSAWIYSNLPGGAFLSNKRSNYGKLWMNILRALALCLMIVALARPQKTDTQTSISSDGIDIVLSLDVSGSMLAEDFKPDRLEAAKQISKSFIQKRNGDRIGLVIFSGESFTQCPITLDHSILLEQLQNIESGMLSDGTAIGNGLATAVDRLREAKGKSKVIILMTDGVNSSLGGNTIDPLTALEIAKAYGIKVYTIGVGTKGKAIMPVPTQTGDVVRRLVDVEIDEPLLKKIAKETGGMYYRATGNESLNEVYSNIDKLEKSNAEISSFREYEDRFYYLLIAALALLLLEAVMRYGLFRSVTE